MGQPAQPDVEPPGHEGELRGFSDRHRGRTATYINPSTNVQMMMFSSIAKIHLLIAQNITSPVFFATAAGPLLDPSPYLDNTLFMYQTRHLVREIKHTASFWRLFEILGDTPWTGLLDSALVDGKLGRYSMICCDPDLVLCAVVESQGIARITLHRSVTDRMQAEPEFLADPIVTLRRLIKERRPIESDSWPQSPPMLGGVLLCLGYETGHLLEDLPEPLDASPPLPDITAIFSRRTLCHCHQTGRTWLSMRSDGNIEEEFAALAERIARFRPDSLPPSSPAVMPSISGLLDQPAYEAAVGRIREDINRGRVFETCMSQQLGTDLNVDGWSLYQELRRINPAPFSAYLKLPDAEVACSSPERFLSLDSRSGLESRPIKGTRPRGATPDEDRRLHDDLASSLKDRAENLMIVDLVRNDIGRVAQYGSVEVPELAIIEAYATVWQMVSTIRGRLREGLDALDAIVACFPGGSMTGAPKIEAMRVIRELEPVRRGIYSGALGYLDFRGNLDLNIVIRTCVIHGGQCDFGVGGAVVADSRPDEEYQESMDKARALIQAIAAANAKADGR